MKNIKLWMLVCIVLPLAFSACENDDKGKTEEPKKTNPDLTYWELKGPVKTCDEAVFDSLGSMVKLGDYNPFAINAPYREIDDEGYMEEYAQWQRNAEGQISTITGIEGITTYTWKDDRVAHYEGFQEGTMYAADYEYDENGNLVKLTEYLADALDEENGGAMPVWATTEYNYIEFDSHGNWIRRQVTRNYANDETIIEDYEETRAITYY